MTPKAQPGNEKPRLFRLAQDDSLINRLGFNNRGVHDAVKRLKVRSSKVILGGNISKNKVTPIENAAEDYSICFEALFPYVDYFVVNVSSPNTPKLRVLQDKAELQHLLSTIQSLNRAKDDPKPVLLKIAPDLNDPQLDDIVSVVESTQIDGLIATNTTISRDNLRTPVEELHAIGEGGLSGQALKDRANYVIRYLHERLNGKVPIIGVGGIMSTEDALEKLEAGASLVQIYTGFIYEGPGLIKSINKALLSQ